MADDGKWREDVDVVESSERRWWVRGGESKSQVTRTDRPWCRGQPLVQAERGAEYLRGLSLSISALDRQVGTYLSYLVRLH